MDSDSTEKKTCRRCKKDKSIDKFPLDCHNYCQRCLISAWEDQIIYIQNPDIVCPKCEVLISKSILKSLLSEKNYRVYRDLKRKKHEKEDKQDFNEKNMRISKIRVLDQKNEANFQKKSRKSLEKEEETEKYQEKELKSERKQRKDAKIKINKESEPEIEKYQELQKNIVKKSRKETKIREITPENDTSNEKNVIKTSKSARKEAKIDRIPEKPIEKPLNPDKKSSKISFSKIEKKPYEIPDKSQENVIPEKEIEEKCQCLKGKKSFTLACGHDICLYCLEKLIRKKLRKELLRFQCPFEEKELKITEEMMEFIEMKEKYQVIFKELKAKEKTNDENDNFFKELSENSNFMDFLSIREMTDSSKNSSDKEEETKENYIKTDKKHREDVKNNEETEEIYKKRTDIRPDNPFLKCPKCFVFFNGVRKGNLIVCDSEKCSKKTKFCFCCRQVLQDSELSIHFENESVYSKCKNEPNSSKIKESWRNSEYGLECKFCHRNSAKKMEACPKILGCEGCNRFFCSQCGNDILKEYIFDHMVMDCAKKTEEKKRFLL